MPVFLSSRPFALLAGIGAEFSFLLAFDRIKKEAFGRLTLTEQEQKVRFYFSSKTRVKLFSRLRKRPGVALAGWSKSYNTSAEAIQHAGPDYQVVKTPIFTSHIHQIHTESVMVFHDELN